MHNWRERLSIQRCVIFFSWNDLFKSSRLDQGSWIEHFAMRERYFSTRHHGTPKHFLRGSGCHQLVLEPGILKITIACDLIEFNRIEISALVIILEDRTAAPISTSPAVFVLQAIPQRDIAQPSCGRNI